MHYSFLHRKSAKDQFVGGEKSPSYDGLQIADKRRAGWRLRLILPTRGCPVGPKSVRHRAS
ncbi:hypothetical protein F6R83_21570 [Citrobacter amalonaticus]|nr:hypothetical protein [Citrobacter amalonaticus]